jgi:ribosomal-protein-alanine N-acetyltransferase
MPGWVAEMDGSIAGFIAARPVASDIEILNLAVRPAARRRGVGARLLGEAVAWAKGMHAENIYIEVRASNQSAQRFYERHGFHETGRRTRYYSTPVEDALLLALSLAPDAPARIKT